MDGIYQTEDRSIDSIKAPSHQVNFIDRKLSDIEREIILALFVRYGGNRIHIAKSLGLCVRTIRKKLKLYGVERGAKTLETTSTQSP